MLLQNPQLAYALLQAQVIMRIVDPATAVVSSCELITKVCSVLLLQKYKAPAMTVLTQ